MLMLKTSHVMLMRLQELELRREMDKAQASAESYKSLVTSFRESLGKLTRSLEQALANERFAIQQSSKLLETLERQRKELEILNGAKRVRSEQPVVSDKLDLLMTPDVQVHEEDEHGELRESQLTEINGLRAELETKLNALAGEIDLGKITPEAAKAATITSEEQWRKEHSEPKETDTDDN